MANVKFRMTARCEAAGRPNNEDNYQLDENLSDNSWGFTTDKEINLSEKGALLVVCDGMGGMNAGEVASAIAVNTIKQCFATERITGSIISSDSAITQFIHDAIQAADAAIKADAKVNAEHEGMGSTIVMAWLLGQKVYVGWCGDSRAYRFNPKTGLERLSHDHSYVQELVDAGKLTEDLAFDHPNNNIITRSLGDPNGKARPDTAVCDLRNEDIIMLCSDGLCGCMRDDEIQAVIEQNQTSMQQCRDALWAADEAAGWHDNVTIALAQILSGGTAVSTKNEPSNSKSNATLINQNKRLKLMLGLLVALLILVIGSLLFWKLSKTNNAGKNAEENINSVVAPNSTDAQSDGKAGAKKQSQEQPPKKGKNKNEAKEEIISGSTTDNGGIKDKINLDELNTHQDEQNVTVEKAEVKESPQPEKKLNEGKQATAQDKNDDKSVGNDDPAKIKEGKDEEKIEKTSDPSDDESKKSDATKTTGKKAAEKESKKNNTEQPNITVVKETKTSVTVVKEE